LAVCWSGELIIITILASWTSRGSSFASARAWSASMILPCMTPPLMTRTGYFLAASSSALAASTASPLMKATAVGPSSISTSSSSPTSRTAMRASVFFNTL
jgi:hypothetical protein